MGGGAPADRPAHGGHAVPGDRDLVDGVAPADDARLPALRRPARGAADAPAPPPLLRGAREDAGDPEPEAPRRGCDPADRVARARPAPPGPDELRPVHLEVQSRLQRRAPVRRPPAARDLRDAPAAGAGERAAAADRKSTRLNSSHSPI